MIFIRQQKSDADVADGAGKLQLKLVPHKAG
jgi:hypothetical protein